MYGINRRGMKVVCVQEMEWEGRTSGKIIPGPTLDKIYTVSDFIDNVGLVAVAADSWSEYASTLAVDLYELPALRIGDRRLGWPIICFRPVEDRATDISALVGIPTRQTEPA